MVPLRFRGGVRRHRVRPELEHTVVLNLAPKTTRRYRHFRTGDNRFAFIVEPLCSKGVRTGGINQLVILTLEVWTKSPWPPVALLSAQRAVASAGRTVTSLEK